MATAQFRLRGRPAHTAGPTFLSYTPDGTKLITVGSNNTARVYKTGSDGEPTNIDDCQEQNTAVAATDKFFVTGSEDGVVSLFSLESMTFEKFLIRTTLPIRDVTLSPDAKWCAVASEELAVKLVNTADESIRYLRDHPKPIKHVSFHPNGRHIALSCTDGQVYVYSLDGEEPELVRTVDGLIRTLESDSDISAKVAWHPDGRAFAAPTATRDIQVMSRGDWANQRSFVAGHAGDITALCWSPNGALLASAGKDKKIILWETKTQKILHRYDHANVVSMAWHPSKNILSFTNSDGEVYIHNDFVPEQHTQLLQLSRQPAPFIHDPLGEVSANVQRVATNGHKDLALREGRHRSPDTVDDILDGEVFDDDDDFVVDDDGAGYTSAINGNGKRPGETLGLVDNQPWKRRFGVSTPQYHSSFQPGSTPWRGNRRYLCLNLTGFVWTVDQDTHHTITIEFHDHEYHRDVHFTDTFRYDKACLNEQGALFSSAPKEADTPAVIFYRPHETWTNRVDWRTELPVGESVAAISLSESYITVVTSSYVRIYTLFGTPYRIYRQKSSPAVSCTSWRDYVMILGNGPVSADGTASLLYTIENIKRDEVCQSQDIVAIPQGASVTNIFFSDNGDPCIYDSTGVLLVLLHWRTPSQARWVPLLDTSRLSRLASGRKQETYWPVAVADDKFHCIILKGQDKHPYFPKPLLSEFDFEIPLASRPLKKSKKTRRSRDDLDFSEPESESEVDDAEEDDSNKETKKLEEAFVRHMVHFALQQDLIDSTNASHSQRTAAAAREVEIDKTLLQLLAVECRNGDDRGMKALELVELIRDNSGRMIEAAGKIASRYNRSVLSDKIRELGEKRFMGMDED